MWQLSHFAPKLPLCALSSSFLWHETQVVFSLSLYRSPLWQLSHFAVLCLASSGYLVFFSWSNNISFQSFSTWQLSHFVPKLPLCLSSFLWHSLQMAGALLYFSSALWQSAHFTFSLR